MITKQQLRSQLLLQRQQTTQNLPTAEKIAQHFVAHPLFQHQQKFAFYFAINDEVDTLPLLTACQQAGKKCFLPIVPAKPSKQLCFVEYSANDTLIINRFGILEPVYSVEKSIAAAELDIVLVPLVAFDQKGNRLGMGAGYYDHTFAFLQNNTPPPHKPFLIGIAHSFQEVSHLPNDPWDVRLNAVMTEYGIKTLG